MSAYASQDATHFKRKGKNCTTSSEAFDGENQNLSFKSKKIKCVEAQEGRQRSERRNAPIKELVHAGRGTHWFLQEEDGQRSDQRHVAQQRLHHDPHRPKKLDRR